MSSENLATELAVEEITAFAARYASFGYGTSEDQMFALLCDVTALYAESQRTPGLSSADAVEGVLDAVADNLRAGVG
jgi:hypothetical protein